MMSCAWFSTARIAVTTALVAMVCGVLGSQSAQARSTTPRPADIHEKRSLVGQQASLAKAACLI